MSGTIAALPWIAVSVPLVLGAFVAAVGERATRITRWLAIAGPLAVLGAGATALATGVEPPVAGGGVTAPAVAWPDVSTAPVAGTLTLDGLGALMLIVVGTIAALVLLYSVGYLAGERSVARYTATVLLFSSAMSLLVTATSLVGILVGWEVMGACSYLLIGYWRERPGASRAAMKAFMTTRVGDMGILLAIALLWRESGTASLSGVFAALPTFDGALVTTVATLLLLGAVGKSAQFPLHVWLPDAMEGPTPVSALIHAATMVAAGVFLVVRAWPVIAASDLALSLALTTGVLTAAGAALAACVQHDIKKVLAYSTISQLGFMFAALGAGAWEVAIFHLITHAAFKGLLFLAAGSLIHGLGTQDLRQMGGALRTMPVTAATWLVGVLALAGVPPFSGFFSKDGVIGAVLHDAPAAGAVLLVAAVLTAYYTTRATAFALGGGVTPGAHAHESPPTMVVPLLALAVPAFAVGLSGTGIADVLGREAHAVEPLVALLSVGAVMIGVAVGLIALRRRNVKESPERAVVTWVRDGYGIDAFYRRAFVRPLVAGARWIAERFDRGVVDRAVEGTASAASWLGARVAALQTGETDVYASLVGAGFVLLMGLVLWLERG